MAGPVQHADLRNPDERKRLPSRKKPYWTALSEGAHLGYYRGQRVRKWVARFRKPGPIRHYEEATIAEADDYADADGHTVLSFRQAQAAASRWFASLEKIEEAAAPRFTVSAALDEYLAGFSGKDIDNTRRRIDAIIRPQMGRYAVADLTPTIIADWHSAFGARQSARAASHGEGCDPELS